MLGLETEWGAWQFDELCAIVGMWVEGNLMNGKPAFEGLILTRALSQSGRENYQSAKGRVTKRVKLKADGTW